MAQSCLPNIVFSIHYAPVHIHPTNRTFPNVLVLPKLKLTRAKGSESLLKLLAGSELLTLGVDTLVVVNKVLLKRRINQATRLVRQLRRPTHPAE